MREPVVHKLGELVRFHEKKVVGSILGELAQLSSVSQHCEGTITRLEEQTLVPETRKIAVHSEVCL